MRKTKSFQRTFSLSAKKLFRIAGFAAFFLLMGINAFAQQSQVRGKITDSQTGDPMAGVNIVVQGTGTGAISESDGSYTITADRNANLVFSFIGYVTQVLPVGGRSTVDVALESEVLGLNEVVVIGYGTVKKATVTGAISTVDGTALQRTPAVNVSNTFAGRLPGLMVVTRSGEPGNDASMMRIRGSNTLGDNSPLIVIDGIAN